LNNELLAKSITSHPAEPKQTLQVDQSHNSIIPDTSKQTSDIRVQQLSRPLLSTTHDISQASQPPEPAVSSLKLPQSMIKDVVSENQPNKTAPVASDREPSVPLTVQSRAVSTSSSREPSVSRFSATASLMNATPRTTPDPSLVDAKPFIAPFKVGGAKALAERRRQQQLELQERKKKLQAEKAANSAIESSKS
jgi:hypothetical protein